MDEVLCVELGYFASFCSLLTYSTSLQSEFLWKGPFISLGHRERLLRLIHYYVCIYVDANCVQMLQ